MEQPQLLDSQATRIELRTYSNAFVHRDWLPPAKPHPDVVVWGERIFIDTGAHLFDQGATMPIYIYREAFTYALTPPARPAEASREGKVG